MRWAVFVRTLGMRHRAAAVWAFALGWLSAPASVRAQSSSEGPSPPRDVVVLQDDSSAVSGALLEQSLRELLSRLGIELGLAGEVLEQRVFARVQVEQRDGSALVTVRRGSDASLIETHEVQASTDELLREAVAHVALGAIEPEWVARESLPTPAPQPAPEQLDVVERPHPDEPAPAWPRGWMATAQGGPLLLSDGRVATAFGVGVLHAYEGRFRPAWSVRSRFWVPSSFDDGARRATLSRFGLALGAHADLIQASWFALEPALAAGLDVASVAPQDVMPPLQATATRTTRLQPILTAGLGGRLRLSRSFELLLAAGAELELLPRQYLVQSAAQQDTLLETGRWRSQATLEIRYALGTTGGDGP